MSAKEPGNQYERRKADTRQRLRDAMQRLQAGNPENPTVRSRKWKLDVKTLAEEAGLSRNAVYQNHGEIVDELRAAQKTGTANNAGASTKGEVRHLKRALDEAESEQRLLATQNAQLLARALQAEKELMELRALHH